VRMRVMIVRDGTEVGEAKASHLSRIVTSYQLMAAQSWQVVRDAYLMHT
jgi:hypothetical protein